MTEQQYTSSKTDLKQVPAIFKILRENLKKPELYFARHRECLDYGGGAGDKLTDKFAKIGVRNLVLDPYNRSEDHNKLVRRLLRIQPADFAICSNVLNVIKEPQVRMQVLREIADLTNPDGEVFFTVYEGNKTSRGRRSKDDCWQANRPLKSYIREIRKVFKEGWFFAGGKALAARGRR